MVKEGSFEVMGISGASGETVTLPPPALHHRLHRLSIVVIDYPSSFSFPLCRANCAGLVPVLGDADG